MSVPFDEPPLFECEGSEDPEASADDLLETIRELLHLNAVQAGGLSTEQRDKLANAVDLLDDLLSAGYALPYAWHLAGTAADDGPPDRPVEDVWSPLL